MTFTTKVVKIKDNLLNNKGEEIGISYLAILEMCFFNCKNLKKLY